MTDLHCIFSSLPSRVHIEVREFLEHLTGTAAFSTLHRQKNIGMTHVASIGNTLGHIQLLVGQSWKNIGNRSTGSLPTKMAADCQQHVKKKILL